MQNLFIRCLEPDAVVELARTFRPGALIYFAAPRRWPGEPRYPTTLKISPVRLDAAQSSDLPRYRAAKRSAAGERLEFEWLQVVDEHNAVDLRLACHLSRQLRTTALAAHASEGTDEYGWGSYHNGVLAAEHFREMEERPVHRVNEELENRGIPYRIARFANCSGPGWRTLTLEAEGAVRRGS